MLFASLARTEEDFRLALHGNLAVCLFLAVSTLALRTPFIFGLHKNGVGATLATGFVIACELWMSETSRARRRAYLLTLIVLAHRAVLRPCRADHGWRRGPAFSSCFSCAGSSHGCCASVGARRLCSPSAGCCSRMSQGLRNRLRSGTLEYPTAVRQRRLALEKFHENPLLGVGVGLRKEYDATNFALLTLAETGVLGLLTIGLVHLRLRIWSGARIGGCRHAAWLFPSRRSPPRSSLASSCMAWSITIGAAAASRSPGLRSAWPSLSPNAPAAPASAYVRPSALQSRKFSRSRC